MPRRSKWAEVLCDTHGKQEDAIKAYKHKSVVVSPGRNKRDKFRSGCPLCKQQNKAKA